MSAVLSAIVAHRTAYATYTAAIDANPSDSPAVLKAGDAERAALNALFGASVSSLSDVAAKAAYLADEVDAVGDYFEEEGGQPLASFLQSLRMSSAAIQPDPLAVLIADYRRQVEISNAAEEDSPEASSWRKPFEALSVDNPPRPTSLAGVLAAIQLVTHEEEIGPSNMTVGVLKAAAAFLEGEVAPSVDQTDNLAEIRRLIEAHRVAEAAFNAFCKQERAIIAKGGRNAYEEGELEHIEVTRDRLWDLMSYPMTTFQEVMAKVAYFRTIPDFLGFLSCFEDPDNVLFDALPETSDNDATPPQASAFLSTLRQYQAERDAHDCNAPDAAATLGASIDRLFCEEGRRPPAIASQVGALAAIKEIQREGELVEGGIADTLLQAVRDFLQRGAAQ